VEGSLHRILLEELNIAASVKKPTIIETISFSLHGSFDFKRQ